MVHLSLLVGELSGAVARGLVDDVRGLYLQVAGLRSTVQEELNQGALQLGAFADVDGEACAGNLYAKVEVNQVVFFCEFPVRQRVFAEVGHRSACLFDYVVCGAGTCRYTLVGGVGDAEKDVADFVFGALNFVGVGFLLALEHGDCLLDFFGLVFFAFLHQLADFCGEFLELVRGLVVLALGFLADYVQRQYVGNGFLGVEAFYCEPFDNPLGVFLYVL